MCVRINVYTFCCVCSVRDSRNLFRFTITEVLHYQRFMFLLRESVDETGGDRHLVTLSCIYDVKSGYNDGEISGNDRKISEQKKTTNRS